MRPVAVVGNVSRDLVDGGPPRIGGGPFHAGRALRVLGRPAVIAAKCAAEHRAALLPELAALGIPVELLDGRSTATFAFSYDGERRSMRVEAVGDPWTPDEARLLVDGPLAGCRWVHVAPVARSDFPVDTLAALAGRGRRLSLDGQGLVRRPEPGELRLDAEYDPELLRHVDVLKLAEEEAAVLTDDVEELRALGVPEVVVTLGSRGSILLAEGETVRVPAHPLPADPTGAGDAFAAAYLSARNAGQPPQAAARRATAVVASLLTARLP